MLSQHIEPRPELSSAASLRFRERCDGQEVLAGGVAKRCRRGRDCDRATITRPHKRHRYHALDCGGSDQASVSVRNSESQIRALSTSTKEGDGGISGIGSKASTG